MIVRGRVYPLLQIQSTICEMLFCFDYLVLLVNI